MRHPPALVVLILLGLVTPGCGEEEKNSDPTSTSHKAHGLSASATVNAAKAMPTEAVDSDDYVIRDYGHAAGATVKHAVTELVRRYYMAAADADGAKVCSMILPSLANAIPEDYGRASGPVYLRGGKTCQAVMTRLLTYSHAQLSGSIDITGVRLKGSRAFVLLRSKTLPYPYITVERHGDTWKITDLLGTTMP